MNLRRQVIPLLAAAWLGATAFGATGLAPLTPEEERVWNRSREEEEVLLRSGFVLEDPAIEDYLTGIISRLAQAGDIDPSVFTVRIVRDPTLNAMAFPHGALFVHTGLLARMMNEAQLAAVLSHEMTHSLHRHGWKHFRSIKTKTAWLSVATVSSGDFSSIVQLLGAFGTAAAVTGYSRALETEADTEGFERMVRAGYDTSEAAAVFVLLMSDLQEHGRKEPFFFGTHPRLRDREQNFSRLNRARKDSSGDKGEERYAAAIRPVLRINGELEMRAGRHDAARDQLWRYVAAEPADVRGHWLLGENERIDSARGDRAEARKLLEKAVGMDPEFAPARRSLGLVCFRSGDHATALVHLNAFLTLDPRATDRAYIEEYIRQCESTVVPPPAS